MQKEENRDIRNCAAKKVRRRLCAVIRLSDQSGLTEERAIELARAEMGNNNAARKRRALVVLKSTPMQ